jgi:hypothetical protein
VRARLEQWWKELRRRWQEGGRRMEAETAEFELLVYRHVPPEQALEQIRKSLDLFDWEVDAIEDFPVREFPAVVGEGRGIPLGAVLRQRASQ